VSPSPSPALGRLVLVSVGFAVLVGPGPLVALVPWLLTDWEIEEPFLGVTALRWVGVALVALGLPALVESIVRFVRRGRGTLVPAVPTEHLVVSGLYRHVRNPMYVAVVAMVMGQSLLFGSGAVLAYAAVLWLGFTLFVVLYEEPTLRNAYGAEYDAYCRSVHRWIPSVRSAPTPSTGGAR
jgi:protein-S-isoprenylcysteine O-methyltransferase Ste14